MNPKFLADVNVGKLAKWLRVLGYDTAFGGDLDDDSLLRHAREEGRILLTRDTHLATRKPVGNGHVRAILIEAERVYQQLEQVISSLGLEPKANSFTRCLACNEPLEPTSREQVKEHIPPYVYQTQERFQQCPRCRRIYWRGTHWGHMKAVLEKLVQGEGR